ncbi:MAG: hypothetical protein IMW89_10050 [Ktedonobacteraceae bacterium]|nr:hypothetical protein [Ktedonobacteraceae bacterium]
MGDIHDVLLNLLANAIWLPIGALLAYLLFLIRVRLPHRRLWRLKDPSRLVVCSATSTMTNTGVYQRPATGVGQLRALVLATRSLHNAYREQLDIQNILLSREPLHEHIENDMLLLGGPKNNEVAAKFLELLHDEQPIKVIGNAIIWRTNHVNGQWLDQGANYYEGHAINRKIPSEWPLKPVRD